MTDRDAPCGDPGRLRGLLEDRLPAEEQAALAGHLEGCAHCRSALERMAAESRWWDDARRLREDDAPDKAGNAPTEEATAAGPPFDFLGPPAAPGYLGRFGPYDVIEFLGRGGSGMVFKALDPTLHRLVAVKVLAPRLAASASARRRFLREARAAASISHDHVVTIHAVDEADGLPYLVMPYVPGKSLQERIDRSGPLGLKEILRIGMQAASGLAAAHAQGLIHRDVKPANILLENGIERVKLTDFGLARAVDDASLTESGVIAGTPQYMAPEQALGEAVGPRADLFGLGGVLYAMATGHSPFRAPTTMAVLRRVCDEPPRPIRESNPEFPAWLSAIIDRLLAKDPADRFASASEVSALLAGHLARLQQTSPDEPVEFLDKAPARPRRRKWLRRLAEVVVVLLVVPFVVWVVKVNRPRPAASPGLVIVRVEDPATHVALDGRTVEIPADGPAGSIRILPLQLGRHHLLALRGEKLETASFEITNPGDRWLASVEIEPPGQPRITLRLSDRGRGRAPAPPPPVVFGPDGVKVDRPEPRATPDRSSPPAGHPPLPAPPTSPLVIEPPPHSEPTPRRTLKAGGTVLDVAYSPDGRYLAVVAARPELSLYDLRAGKAAGPGLDAAGKGEAKGPDSPDDGPAPVTTRKLHPFNGTQQVAFSPEGALMASSGGDGTVRLWDVATLADPKVEAPEPLAILGSHGFGGKDEPRTSMAFAPDGRLLATGGADGKVSLWDPASRSALGISGGPGGDGKVRRNDPKPLLELPMGPFPPPVHDLRFSLEGKTLAVSTRPAAQGDRGVQLWRIRAGSPPTAERRGVLDAGTPESPARLAFAKDGSLSTFGPGLPMVSWDLRENRGFRLPLGTDATALAFSRDGLMALGEGDGRVWLVDGVTFPEMEVLDRATLRAGRAPIRDLAFSPDGQSLATATADHDFRVLIWDVPAGPEKSSREGKPTQAEDNPSGARPGDPPPQGSAPVGKESTAAKALAEAWLRQADHRLATARADLQAAEARVGRANAALAAAKREFDAAVAAHETAEKALGAAKALLKARPQLLEQAERAGPEPGKPDAAHQ